MGNSFSVTEAVEKFVIYIRRRYVERQVGDEDELLRCNSEKLVRLELVESERMPASEQRGSGGDKVRTPLAYTNIFKVEGGKEPVRKVLVEGGAGVGKTTFCTAVSEKWAKGEILQEFELLLLLPLREQKVASAGSLLDLLKFLYPTTNTTVHELVKKYFEKHEEKVLVIADGWDELGEEKRKKDSFLYGFLFRSQCCLMSTLLTSRPSASASLHLVHKCIDRFVEIRGFDKEHIVEYINSEFSSDQKQANELIKKLEINPLIESICSIPLNCVIVCHLWKIKGDLPTTMTGLYTQIVFNILLRNIRKVYPAHENMLSLSSFDDLPESLQESWWLLCEFAFQALKKDQLVFSDKELMDFFPRGLSLGDKILCFGLLQSSVSSLEVGCGRSFHFLHLTFQEYLAALYLVKQECSQVTLSDSLLSRLTTLFEVPVEYDIDSEDKSDPIVLRFFFGITYAFEIFQSSIGQRILTALTDLDEYHSPHRLVLYHWAFEAHNDQFVHIVVNKLDGSYPHPNTIQDFAVMVYMIDNTPECTNVVIRLAYCGLHDSHITTLTDILSSKDGKLQVKRLDLSHNELTDRGVNDLFIRASAAFQSLEHLQLDGSNRIGGECINSILATLGQPFNKCPEIKFSFRSNHLDVPSLMVFRDALCHHQLSNLTSLDLYSSLSSDALANGEFILALGHCHGLKDLDLSYNNLRAPGGRALGKVLPQLSLMRLQVFGAKLGDEGMAALTLGLESTCHIGHLHLSNNDIHAAGISYLADSICAGKIVIKNILSLIENSLGLEGAVALVRMLSSKHFQAENVRLNYCGLTTAEGDSAHSISPHFDESITYVGIREWVCRYKIKADSVKILHLYNNNFSGEGIRVLAAFMYLCPQLRNLFCGDCEITSNDLKQLLSLLSQLNLNLEYWNLNGNNFDDDGVSALIEHLPMFPSLTCIKVNRNNQISTEMHRNLEEICEKRKKIQKEMKQRRQCGYVSDDKTTVMDSPVLGHENGAGTEVSDQYSIPDSVEPTILEPHLVCKEVQQIELIVSEREISPGQNECPSDNENYFTPPSSPAAERMKLQEGESEHPIPEGRATENTSSLDTTGLRGETRTVASEEVDQLYPTVELGRTATPGPQVGDIVSALKEITNPYLLGIQLGIETYELKKIEKNYPQDIDRQMAEVINHWLRNSSDCSWEVLANAVEKMGGHGNLVKRLRNRHLEA